MSDPDACLTVQADSADSSLGWATLGDRRWRCVVGAGGAREDKVEGDAATPVGNFPLRRIYFRNDRLVLPKVRPAGPADHRARRLVRRSALVRLQPAGPHPERLEPREAVARRRAVRPGGGGRLQRRSARGRMGQRDLPPHRPRRPEPDPRLRRLRPRRSARARAAAHAGDEAAGPGSIGRRSDAPPATGEDDMKPFEDFDEKDW